MPGKVRIGFIGCGFMGQCVHLPSFRRVKSAEIIAIADLRPNLARAVAEKWKIGKVYSSHIEMVEDKNIDAVVVITNKFTHAPIVIDSLNAGKHVFVEKPMATTSEDAKKMIETARKTGLKLMVGYMKRYDTGVLKAKEVFKELVETDEITFVRSHIFGGDWICGSPAEEMIRTDEKYPEIRPKFSDFLPKDFVKAADNLLEQIHDINLPRYFIEDPIAVDFSKVWSEGFVALLDYGEYPLLLEMSSISADFWEEQLLINFKNGWIDLRP
ncbi:MAG: Gfo/Idh/MocA family oxidoreductase, partial [Candidatus Bathyarchaeia archaeon]